MDRIKIKEAIVVEGRDDTSAVKKAVDGFIIETHGFGIKKETWKILEKAYEERGLIILTDPDFSGEEIRKKITQRFPKAKQAFISRQAGTKKGDIGVENGTPEVIIEALKKVHVTFDDKKENFTYEDLVKENLVGHRQAKKRREFLGEILSIGYGNGKSLLNKLNTFRVSREEFYEALCTVNHKED